MAVWHSGILCILRLGMLVDSGATVPAEEWLKACCEDETAGHGDAISTILDLV